ncbi:putative Ig domain-containing protein, partial [Thalassospira sp. MCCC 1A01428]|uniref:putative Ig domain-containing protein n=1 Tax=Thalassospira sp. MCCC 1A01428 TaxID=1470575 RepID=UPI000A242466
DFGNMSVNVTGVNDAPTVAGVPATVTVIEDSASDLDLSAITFTDVDSGATLTVTFTAGAGTLAASDGTGVTVGGTSTALTLTGTVSAINTYLDTVGAIKYTSATNAEGTGVTTIGVKANDGAGSGDVAFGNISVNVTDVNDAPTLTNGGVVTLPTTNEDTTSSGTAVSTILTSAGYADADAGANSGIAITGLTGNGTWQYSTDGTTWVTIGPASTTSALLLNSSSQVRFVPDGKNGETASLSIKAWDQTTGVASTSGIRNTADTTTSGGTAAFSNEVASTKIVVSDVNDAPTGPGGLPGVTVENGGPLNYSLSVAGFADVDGDNLTFTATLADGSALPQWLNYSVNGTNVTFSGTVPGDFIGAITVRITATEDASAHLTATSDLIINVEQRPIVVPPAAPPAPTPVPVPPVMTPPGNGNLGDAGTPVNSAIDFGGRNGGDIVQPVTGQLGSLSPIDTSPTPVMAGLQSTTPPSIFADSGGQTIFGGDVGGGTGILAARTQLITSQGSGVGGQGPANGATGNGPDGSGGNDLPSGNEDINGGGGSNAAPAGNVPAEQAPEQAPEQGEQDGSAEPSSDNSPSAASPDGAPDNSSGNENGDVPPSDAGNVQGSLMVPGMSPFDTAANMDFTDQLAGAGNAFDRHASLLSKALSHYDASAA